MRVGIKGVQASLNLFHLNILFSSNVTKTNVHILTIILSYTTIYIHDSATWHLLQNCTLKTCIRLVPPHAVAIKFMRSTWAAWGSPVQVPSTNLHTVYQGTLRQVAPFYISHLNNIYQCQPSFSLEFPAVGRCVWRFSPLPLSGRGPWLSSDCLLQEAFCKPLLQTAACAPPFPCPYLTFPPALTTLWHT